MKGTVASFMFTVFLGLYFITSPVHGDTVYVSTFNLDTIYEINSSGNESTFATASFRLERPSRRSSSTAAEISTWRTREMAQSRSSVRAGKAPYSPIWGRASLSTSPLTIRATSTRQWPME